MNEQTLTLLDAIRLAKEAEQQASVLYGNAAQEATNPLVRRLFEQLAAFEELHYEKLLDLETSLRDKGAFIKYEGREDLAVHAEGEVKRIEGAKKTTGMKVIRQAMDIERSAAQLNNFLRASVDLMKVMARACGHSHLNQFNRDDLATLDWSMARLSGISFSGLDSDPDR